MRQRGKGKENLTEKKTFYLKSLGAPPVSPEEMERKVKLKALNSSSLGVSPVSQLVKKTIIIIIIIIIIIMTIKK